MNLQLYARVLWRFRWLVLVGTLAAFVLAFFSYASVSFKGGSPHLKYRESQFWQSQASVLITQEGFPWGRTVLPAPPVNNPAAGGAGNYADPNRLAQLAVFYSQLANSDAIQRLVLNGYPKSAKMTAAPDQVGNNGNGYSLPFVQIFGVGLTKAMAVAIADRGSRQFQSYIAQQQETAGIPAIDRVRLEITTAPRLDKAQLLTGRKKTTPIVILLTVLIATFGLAFILENLRPAVRSARVPADVEELRQPATRTA